MQDRFKFRFWDKETQTMQKIPMVELRHRITLDKIFADDRVIFMQCTGLKDKNGKLIYEGDIVTYDWLTPIGKVWRTDGKHIVEWHNGFTVIGNIAGYDVEHGKTKNVEVIGNIYENAELLEEK